MTAKGGALSTEFFLNSLFTSWVFYANKVTCGISESIWSRAPKHSPIIFSWKHNDDCQSSRSSRTDIMIVTVINVVVFPSYWQRFRHLCWMMNTNRVLGNRKRKKENGAHLIEREKAAATSSLQLSQSIHQLILFSKASFILKADQSAVEIYTK